MIKVMIRKIKSKRRGLGIQGVPILKKSCHQSRKRRERHNKQDKSRNGLFRRDIACRRER